LNFFTARDELTLFFNYTIYAYKVFLSNFLLSGRDVRGG
jgi:hypothetical protein